MDLYKFTKELYQFFNDMVNDQPTPKKLNDFFTDDFSMFTNSVQVAGSLEEFSGNLQKLKASYKQVRFELPFKDILVDSNKVCILLDTYPEDLIGNLFVTHVMAIYYLDQKVEKFNKKVEITSTEKR